MPTESSDAASDGSSLRLTASAPSSPPPAEEPEATMEFAVSDHQQILEEEKKARIENKERYKAAALKRRRKTKALTKEEREAKARELDQLLRQSEAFSDILTKKTEILGRAGSGFDGKKLGEHDLKMATQPKCLVGGEMRDYQLEGLTWMFEICQQGMSGILADEMGLGKTIQTISLIALLREQENYLGPHLIIAPLSTLSNWLDEFHKWAPSIPIVMYHGNPQQRRKIFNAGIIKHLQGGRPTVEFPVVCTSYEIVLRDRASLSKINWEFIIIDEGHRMKNFDSKLFRELQTFRSATRLLITGTPLQNNLKELWSLLHFLLPNIFADWDAFETWFDFSDLEDEERAEEFIGDDVKQDLLKKIHRILQPLLLRRVKADVAYHLPKKREYILYAPMTKEQTDLYNVINDKSIDTRAWLEDKVVKHLTGATTTPVASLKSGRQSSRIRINGPADDVTETEPVAKKTSPPSKKKLEVATSARVNAFTLMMGKGKPLAQLPKSKAIPAAPVAAPAKKGVKRHNAATKETSPSKSAKSSRNSSPATTIRARGRVRKGEGIYKEAHSSEDELSDDEFELKLAEEFDATDSDELGMELAAEEFERLTTLDLAKKEIANKKLGNPLMQLRLVCNSPHMFYNPWASDIALPVDESIVTASGKMLLLDRLLPALFKKGHKVLIFSQFKTQLDILEDYCRDLRKWHVCRIDGSVAQDDRRRQIKEFNEDRRRKVFLLSTRAGGLGINLASADTVILFDSDFNPQMDLQAQDRAHRIGQTRPVVVYRLATKGTVEEMLLLSADAKRRLEKLVIRKGSFRTMGQKMDLREDLDKETLRSLLLRDGEVYKFSGDEQVLSDKDLGILLDRSDAAYDRAATGLGNADGYKVIETGVNGIAETGTAPQ